MAGVLLYDGSRPFTLKNPENNVSIEGYNKILKNMEADLVDSYIVYFYNLSDEVKPENQKSMLLKLYKITDYNEKIPGRRVDTMEGAREVPGMNAQITYAACFSMYKNEKGENRENPWEYDENLKEKYFSVSDPRELVIARNYPVPYSDYANILIKNQQKPFVDRIKICGKNNEYLVLTNEKNFNEILTENLVNLHLAKKREAEFPKNNQEQNM